MAKKNIGQLWSILLTNEARRILQQVDQVIQTGATNSEVCAQILTLFYQLFDEANPKDVPAIIDALLQQISVTKYNNTILFGFLTAANYQRAKLTHYDNFLTQIELKIQGESPITKAELDKIFYGLK